MVLPAPGGAWITNDLLWSRILQIFGNISSMGKVCVMKILVPYSEPGCQFLFCITAMGRAYSDLGLPTTKHERVLDLSTLSYKKKDTTKFENGM